MAIPPEVPQLVERFGRGREEYRSGRYKEAQLRAEFIDPLFECLGWDIYNKQGYTETHKDVIHEDAIKIRGAIKAPDYCFRIGGARKFFLEAKKPSVDIKDDVHPAYQLCRYAWSAKLPLSILTDFEEFAAYDCRIKPSKIDKASAARVLYLTYTQYAHRWDEIASVFSRDAVLKGSFDKYVESTKRKRGTAEVDAAFLKEIESWREMLARNIALRNPQLTRRELNFAVQRTIDRIIFLRICEARAIEHYGQLMDLRNGTNVYARLCKLFYRADERYNSGLFHFRKEKGRPDAPDELTPRLAVDDKPLKDIVKRLYYPESPYEFSVLPADILGQVYEQFLGKVIRLTPAHRAVVEDKPEVKKAGGIYYTPTYIVDYIVKNTVGTLLEGSGVGDQGSGKGEERDGDSNVSGPGGMAEEHGPRGGSLSVGKALSTGGTIRPDESDPPSRSLNSGEYRGGAWAAPSRGLPSVSFHRERLTDGGRNPFANRRQAGLSQPGSSPRRLEAVPGGGPSAERSYPLTPHQGAWSRAQTPQNSKPQAQSKRMTSDPRSLIPDPRPLNPNEAANLRILDPACGSGSFLLGAYQYLLDWHLNWYTTHNPEKWDRKRNPPIYQILNPKPQTPNPNWRLTTAERKRILLNNIYGVDIDPQAVEVTKLSLLLKVLEGENEQTLEKQLKLFRERALPDLASNIKCGNSLIGPDFYDNRQMTLLDDDERYRINAFDWNAEFPEIMRSGGFDAVIGNPPYHSYSGRQAAESSKAQREYFRARYSSAGWLTSHGMFIQRAVEHLSCRFVALIVPDQVGHLAGYAPVRETLRIVTRLSEVRYWGEHVFQHVTTPALTFIADREHKEPTRVCRSDGRTTTISLSEGQPWVVERRHPLMAKLRWRSRSLGDLVADPGVHTGNCSSKLILPEGDAGPHSLPVLEGKQISRYLCQPPAKVLRMDYSPKSGEYFTIRPRERYAGAEFLIRQTAAHPIVGPRQHATYFRNSLLALYSPSDGTDVRYLVGLLNSRLTRYVYEQSVHESHQKAFPQVKVRSLRELPMPAIDLSDSEDKARHDRMVKLVERMLELHNKLASAKTAHEKTVLHRQIDKSDRQIDQLAYELYHLTEEEITIVGEETAK